MADSRTVTVNVTQEDIDQSIFPDEPIWRALRRAVPTSMNWRVGEVSFGFYDQKTWWKADTTEEMRAFVNNRLHGRPVSPFQFTAVFERA